MVILGCQFQVFSSLGRIAASSGPLMVGMCSDKDAFYGYIDRVCTYLSLFRRKLPMYISTIISAYVSMIDLKKKY